MLTFFILDTDSWTVPMSLYVIWKQKRRSWVNVYVFEHLGNAAAGHAIFLLWRPIAYHLSFPDSWLTYFCLSKFSSLTHFHNRTGWLFFPCFTPKLAKNNNLVLWFSSSYLSSLFGSFSFVLFIYLFFMVFSTVFWRWKGTWILCSKV